MEKSYIGGNQSVVELEMVAWERHGFLCCARAFLVEIFISMQCHDDVIAKANHAVISMVRSDLFSRSILDLKGNCKPTWLKPPCRCTCMHAFVQFDQLLCPSTGRTSMRRVICCSAQAQHTHSHEPVTRITLFCASYVLGFDLSG